MRKRALAPIAVLGAAAVALVGVSPVMAAISTWTSPSDSWWSTATWGGAVPIAGDDVVFAGGPRSTYDLGNLSFASLTFTNDHTIANGGGEITLSDGLTAEAGVEARIETGLRTAGDQTWQIATGAALELPGWVYVDPASTLTLDIGGTVRSTGNLDGAAAACIVKTGSGVLELSGAGGGVGSCGGGTEGLRVEAGYVDVLPGAALGGKSFDIVAGGVLIGGDLASPSQVRQLNLNSGIVSPGANGGLELGELHLWGTSTWNAGVYEVDWDPATGDSDLVHGDGQAIAVNGTRLMPYVWGPDDPVAEGTFTVLSSSVGITGAFISPAGAALADGDEFTAEGWLYRYTQSATEVSLTWIGPAPLEPEPETPTNPTPPREVSTATAGATAPLGATVPAVAAVFARARR